MVEQTEIDIEPDAGDGLADAGAALIAAAACLACGAAIAGHYCGNCGQKNDDMRRSSLLLARDFLRDTFGFDSRMWRTLGLMAVSPGAVPANYAHGKRSSYTPPVRLFLVVSFLFFLTLALSRTLIIAFEVWPKTAEEIAADKAALEQTLAAAELDIEMEIGAAHSETSGARDVARDGEPVLVDGRDVDCDLHVKPAFFVHREDVRIDPDAWRRCADSVRQAAETSEFEDSDGDKIDSAIALKTFERVLNGLTAAIENPAAFNKDVNDWLARVMFLMTPVLALLLALFFRGRDALLFDHLVLSLYAHAAGFAIVALGIVATLFKVPHAGAATGAAITLYLFIAIRRAYRRGWLKTTLATAVILALYLAILSSATMGIVINAVWENA